MPTVKRKTFDKQVNCILPENLNPQELREQIDILDKKAITDVQFWRYLRFIDLLTSDRKKDAEGWVTLWCKILEKNLTSEYKDVKGNLKRLGIIEVYQNKRSESYSTLNNESKRYRLTDTFRDERTVLVPAYKRIDPKKPVKELECKRTDLLLSNPSTPEYNFLKSNLHKLYYDVEAVERDFEEWLNQGVLIKGEPFNEVTREMMRRNVTELNSDYVKFTVGETGRVSSYLTNSYKVLRRRVKIRGYEGEICHADVSSTQWLLMLPEMRLYKQQLTDPKAKEELSKFESMLNYDQFYKTLSTQLEAEGVVIVDIKKDLIRKVANYKEGQSQSPYYQAFSKLYPAVTEFLRVLKNGKSFTTVMTPKEAVLFNSRIARRVYEELGSQTFLGGIYDAFIFKKTDKEAILKIMNEEVLYATGLHNKVKVSNLSEESEKDITYPQHIKINTEEVAGLEPSSVNPTLLADKEDRDVAADTIEWNREDAYRRIIMSIVEEHGDKVNRYNPFNLEAFLKDNDPEQTVEELFDDDRNIWNDLNPFIGREELVKLTNRINRQIAEQKEAKEQKQKAYAMTN